MTPARAATRLRPSRAAGAVPSLDALRITRALAGRARYRYVVPRISVAECGGWMVHSPNCSRNIDRRGGEIPIAWFQPDPGPAGAAGRWLLHAHDHAAGRWVLQASGLSLPRALATVCQDSARLYWP